jgi:hypothetical protein
MGYQQKARVFAQLRQRAMTILQTEGLAGLAKRVVKRLSPLHYSSYIVALSLNHSIHAPLPDVDVEIRQIRATDDDDLEALAEVDEWGKSKAQILELLAEGHQCYVATFQGQIVSSNWWVLNGEYHDREINHKFKLAANEVYMHSGFTIPAFRGSRIIPYLLAQVNRDVACALGKTRALGRTWVNNKAMLLSLAKLGATRVGQAGFVEVLGIRFHYLWGRNIFERATKRFFVERM